jgi:hypothetical protein
MRRILAIAGMCLFGALGCQHVGGKCDCGPQPGEAGMYAPYTTPTTTVKPAPAPTTTPPADVPK